MKIKHIRTPAECINELLALEAGGGVTVDFSNKITPNSLKARQIADKLIELSGRRGPHYDRLADAADWSSRNEGRRILPALFAPISQVIGVGNSHVSRGASRGDMMAHRHQNGHRPSKGRRHQAA